MSVYTHTHILYTIVLSYSPVELYSNELSSEHILIKNKIVILSQTNYKMYDINNIKALKSLD